MINFRLRCSLSLFKIGCTSAVRAGSVALGLLYLYIRMTKEARTGCVKKNFLYVKYIFPHVLIMQVTVVIATFAIDRLRLGNQSRLRCIRWATPWKMKRVSFK